MSAKEGYRKSQLLKELAYKVGIKKALSQKILDALAEIIYREAPRGGFVLPGICRFDVVDKKERRMRNPRTGEALVVPPHKALRATLSNKARRLIAPKPRAVPLASYVPPAPVVEPVPAEETPVTVPAPTVAEAPVVVPAPVPVAESEPAPVVAEAPVAEPEPAPVVAEAPVAEPEPAPVVAESPAANAEAVPAEEKPIELKPPVVAETPLVPQVEEGAQKVEEPKAEEPKAISFKCPGCGQEIEAPSEAIGMEAECPMCGRIVVVPKESEPGTMYGAPIAGAEARNLEPVITAEEAEEMEPSALKNRTIRIDTTLFGFDDDDDEVESSKPPPQESSVEEEKLISFFCKKCHQEIEATSDMCGSSCECPNCGETFEVPYFSDPGSIHDDSVARKREQMKIEAQKHSTMRINLDEF